MQTTVTQDEFYVFMDLNHSDSVPIWTKNLPPQIRIFLDINLLESIMNYSIGNGSVQSTRIEKTQVENAGHEKRSDNI